MKVNRVASRSTLLACFAFSTALAIPGCGVIPQEPDVHLYQARTPETVESDGARPREAVIFGRVHVVLNGEKVEYGRGLFSTSAAFWLQSKDSVPAIDNPTPKIMQVAGLRLLEDGLFVYAVPAARYELRTLLVHEPNHWIWIQAVLETECGTPGVAYYLGDLEIDIDTGLGGDKLNYLEVVDRYDDVRARVVDRLRMLGIASTQKAPLTRIRGQVPTLRAP